MRYKFEAAAKRCESMPEGLTLPEQMAFQALAALTVRYRCGMISAELAKRERRRIDAAYDKAAQNEKNVNWCTGLRKRIEAAMNAYRLDRTLENADRLVGVIDGFIREEGTQ
ncbi:MAG: hypothetical protein II642_06065 [Firmicutes bacterium]|nr:hypothetical protein [Bacillota bacterium]